MRGFPLLNALLILGCLILFALPLASLTGQRNNTPTSESDELRTTESETTDALLSLRFAHRPDRVSVRHGDETLLTLQAVEENPVESDLSLPAFSPDEGIELLIDVSWPETTPETVVEATLEPTELETRRATAWGGPSLFEVLTFSWPTHEP